MGEIPTTSEARADSFIDFVNTSNWPGYFLKAERNPNFRTVEVSIQQENRRSFYKFEIKWITQRLDENAEILGGRRFGGFEETDNKETFERRVLYNFV